MLGLLLPSSLAVQETGLEDGDSVTAVVQSVQVAANSKGFAIIRTDGNVAIGGDSELEASARLRGLSSDDL